MSELRHSKPRDRALLDGLSSAVATVSGNLFLVLGTLVLATLAILVSWIPPRGNLVFAVARLWSRGLLATSGMRVDRDTGRGLDPGRRYVFMANHRSLYDIPALISTLPVPARFLAKKSLFKIPLFGWALTLGGFVNIDRQNLGSARDSFAVAIDRLRRGASLLVFPEGTRSRKTEMLPFQRGGFLLALKSGMPIVPVGIVGTGRARRRGSLKIRPSRIRIHYGSPIETAELSVRDKNHLMQEVRDRIDELRAGPAAELGRPGPERGAQE